MSDQPQTRAPHFERLQFVLYNSLTRQREPFVALAPPHVGMYVCGPTVYSDPHLGHARSAIVFDTLVRTLRLLGYRVRYVRNVTDVGHLADEVAGAGEDRIAARARLEQVEPMEVVQRYTLSYHEGLRRLNCLPPSIEPRASGHIPEQIEVIRRIVEAGYAYEADGSVYFDLRAYIAAGSPYGQLSGRVVDDLLANTRATAGATDKRSSLDFALWKRAEPEHIMRWKSPWSDGFPGWHLECTAMSTRYLGTRFDIHGGGLDLQFPHHEAEIAQNRGAFGHDPAQFWVHHNMLTVEGQKMAKSIGNFITLDELFSGRHPSLERAYDPMVVRFFVLQTHYRSPVDFSNEALTAAARGFERLAAIVDEARALLGGADDDGGPGAHPAATAARAPVGPADDPIARRGRDLRAPAELGLSGELAEAVGSLWEAILDDMHTPRAIAALFRIGHLMRGDEFAGAAAHAQTDIARLVVAMTEDVLGLDTRPAAADDGGVRDRALEAAMSVALEARRAARGARDFARADAIRDALTAAGIQIEDHRDGTSGWTVKREGA